MQQSLHARRCRLMRTSTVASPDEHELALVILERFRWLTSERFEFSVQDHLSRLRRTLDRGPPNEKYRRRRWETEGAAHGAVRTVLGQHGIAKSQRICIHPRHSRP